MGILIQNNQKNPNPFNFFAIEGQTVAVVDARAAAVAPIVVAQKCSVFEQEMQELLTILKQDHTAPQAYWYYLLYCSTLLREHYRRYGDAKKAQHYQDISEDIVNFYLNGQQPPVPPAPIWFETLLVDLDYLYTTPLHSSSLRSWFDKLHFQRLSLTFARIVFLQTASLFLLDTSGVNVLAPPLYFLSVGIFACRLTINTAEALKHILYDTDGTMYERFQVELQRRNYQMGNDIVWFTVNLLTNYRLLFGISSPTADILTGVFFVFDSLWLAVAYYQDYQIYKSRKNDYLDEINYFSSPSIWLFNDGQRNVVMANQQLALLEAQWHQKENAYWCGLIAGGIMGVSFNLSLFFPFMTTPLILLIAVALAFAFAADQYGNYAKQAYILKEDNTPANQEACVIARNQFLMTMATNTIKPLLIIGVATISWPLSLLLLVGLPLAEYGYALSKQESPQELPVDIDFLALAPG